MFKIFNLCRNFAKRQLTWFRNEKIYHWLDASKPLVCHWILFSALVNWLVIPCILLALYLPCAMIWSDRALAGLCIITTIFLQDKVLNFIYDAYHDKSENLVVPQWLQMRKDTNHREAAALKAYRTRNRYWFWDNGEFVLVLLHCWLAKILFMSPGISSDVKIVWRF